VQTVGIAPLSANADEVITNGMNRPLGGRP
jgi:hypothetical protein